ncbi:MAG: hypothetical protein N2691_02690 [Patescibacteria group bacterium]|nr:hypothetical protein [Patescibacteria group bacterium]
MHREVSASGIRHVAKQAVRADRYVALREFIARFLSRFSLPFWRSSGVAYSVVLLSVIGSLFVANYTPSTIFSNYGTFFSTLEHLPLFVKLPLLSYLFAFGALFVGALGVMVFLEQFPPHQAKRLFATLGGIAYVVNPVTLATFREPSFAGLILTALFPWLILSWIMFLDGKSRPLGPRLMFLLGVNMLAFPAFPTVLQFLVYIAFLLLLGIGLFFTKYLYRIFWVSPWLLVLVLLVHTHWLAPQIAGSSESWRSLFDITPLSPLPVVWSALPQSGVGAIAVLIAASIAVLGFFRLRWLHIGFAVATAGFLAPFLPVNTLITTALQPYQGLLLVPLGFCFAYFFTYGGAALTWITGKLIFRNHGRSSEHRDDYRQPHGHDPFYGKTPYDLYEEMVQATHAGHGGKQFAELTFTTLQFTEHLVQHLLEQKHAHYMRTTRKKRLVPRLVVLALVLLLVVGSFGLFGGMILQKHKVSYTPELRSLVEHISALPSDTPATFVHASQPVNFRDRELKYALQSENPDRIAAVLDKYSIKCLVLDRDQLPARVQQAVNKVKGLQQEKSASGVTVYKVNIVSLPARLSLVTGLPNVGPVVEKTIHDVAFETYGDYLTSDASRYTAFYPFLDIEGSDIRMNAEETVFRQKLDQTLMKHLGEYELETGTEAAELIVTAEDGSTRTISYSLYSEIVADRLSLIMQTEPVREFSFNAKDAGRVVTNLTQQRGYLASVDSGGGASLNYVVDVSPRDQPTSYYSVQTRSGSLFIIPPISASADGYRFAISPAQYESLSIFYIPFDDIIRTRFASRELPRKPAVPRGVTYSYRLGRALIEVQPPPELAGPNQSVLVFPEPFDSNWRLLTLDDTLITSEFHAFLASWFPFQYGVQTGTHARLNGWANAWELHSLSPNRSLYLVYWPLYVTYAGWVLNALFLAIAGGAWLLGRKQAEKKKDS